MLLYELADSTPVIIKRFADYVGARLDIESMPKIKIKRDSEYSAQNHTFGHYTPDDNIIMLQISNRQILDILRTLAHELVHHKQNLKNQLSSDSGETGSRHENQANAMAAILMRDFAKDNSELFNRAAE